MFGSRLMVGRLALAQKIRVRLLASEPLFQTEGEQRSELAPFGKCPSMISNH